MLGGGSSGFSPHLSFSVSDNLSISASGSMIENDFKKYHFAETGLTYFYFQEKPLHVSFTLGAGAGQVVNDFTDSVHHSDIYIRYYKFYAQPSIGFTTDFFDGYLNLKFAYLNSPQIFNANVYTSGNDLFLEPALGLQVGYKFVKFYAQWQFAFPVMLMSDIAFTPIQINLGIRAKFPLKNN